MSDMIPDPYATRGENLRHILRLLPCVLLGHAPATQRWPHCTNCRRCHRTLAYGPEITDDWPDAMKAAWRGGKRTAAAHAEENWRRNAASAIEAQRAETAETGSVADESAASEAGDAR